MSIKEVDNREITISINEMTELDYQRWENYPVANQVQLIDSNNQNNYRYITISNNSNQQLLNFNADGSNNFYVNGDLLINENGFEVVNKPNHNSNDNFSVDDLIDNCLKTGTSASNNNNNVINYVPSSNPNVSFTTNQQNIPNQQALFVTGKTIPITDLTSTNGQIRVDDVEMIDDDCNNTTKHLTTNKTIENSATATTKNTVDNMIISEAKIKKPRIIEIEFVNGNNDVAKSGEKSVNDNNNVKKEIDNKENMKSTSTSVDNKKSPSHLITDKKEDGVDNVKTELSMDPSKLLENLSPILDLNGGLKELDDSFVKLMKDCQAMPGQCLLINIVRSTCNSVIKKLLLKGAWSQLYVWLQEACTQINKPLMMELLQLFKLLPVNTQLLRSNSCAKDIKQLIKNSDERIARLARVIVDEWMKVVKGPSGTSTSSKSSASSSSSTSVGDKLKKKPTDGEKIKQPTNNNNNNINNNNNNNNSMDRKNSNPDKNRVNNNNGKNILNNNINNNTNNNNNKLEKNNKNINNNNNNNKDKEAIDKKERPKTVKMRPHKFRMTGLEDSKSSADSSSSSGSNLAKLSTKNANKNIPNKDGDMLNKVANISTTPVVAKPPNFKITPAKPISPEVFEKSMFMDALQASTSPPLLKRKRKLMGDSTKSSTSATATTAVATTSSSSGSGGSGGGNNIMASTTSSSSSLSTSVGDISSFTASITTITSSSSSSSSPPHLTTTTTTSSSSTTTTTTTTTTPTTTSTTTTTTTTTPSQQDYISPAKKSRLSVDNDTELPFQTSSSPSSSPPTSTSPPPITTTAPPSSSSSSASSSSTSLVTKLKKSVTWASDVDLCSFHYFEFDADERCNVNNKKSSNASSSSSSSTTSSSGNSSDFQDHRKHELEMERELLFGKYHHSKNRSCEQIEWRCPPLIDIMVPPVPVESEEKGTQARREALVLQVIYFDRERIPDSPAEPDEPQPSSPADQSCRIIPLEDIDDDPMGEKPEVDEVVQLDTTPASLLVLPEAITNLLGSYMNSSNIQSNESLSNLNNPIGQFEPGPTNQSNYYNQYGDQSNNGNNMPVYPIGFNANNNNNNNNMERKSYDPGYSYNNNNNNNNMSYQNNTPRFDNPNFPNQRRRFDGPPRRYDNSRGRGGHKNYDSKVCQFYLSGNCRFGNNCKKIHPPK